MILQGQNFSAERRCNRISLVRIVSIGEAHNVEGVDVLCLPRLTCAPRDFALCLSRLGPSA